MEDRTELFTPTVVLEYSTWNLAAEPQVSVLNPEPNVEASWAVSYTHLTLPTIYSV